MIIHIKSTQRNSLHVSFNIGEIFRDANDHEKQCHKGSDKNYCGAAEQIKSQTRYFLGKSNGRKVFAIIHLLNLKVLRAKSLLFKKSNYMSKSNFKNKDQDNKTKRKIFGFIKLLRRYLHQKGSPREALVAYRIPIL